QAHLPDAKVAALIARPSTAGTRNPEPVGSSAPSATTVTRAIDAYSTPESRNEASAATSASSLDAAGAGTASTTASKDSLIAAVVGPITRDQPRRSRLIARTAQPRRTSSRSARAIGNEPIPPRNPASIGPEEMLALRRETAAATGSSPSAA